MEFIVENKIVKKRRVPKIVVIIIIFTMISIGGGLFLLYGPYSGFRNFLITTAMTTMNHQYLATFFYSDDVISKVLEENKLIENSESTNTLKINTSKIETVVYKNKYEKDILEHNENEEYKLLEIKEKNFSGYLVAIYDLQK